MVKKYSSSLYINISPGAVFAQFKIILGVDSIEGKAFETSSKVKILNLNLALIKEIKLRNIFLLNVCLVGNWGYYEYQDNRWNSVWRKVRQI